MRDSFASLFSQSPEPVYPVITQAQKDRCTRDHILRLFAKPISLNHVCEAVKMFEDISNDGVKLDLLRAMKENHYSYDTNVIKSNADHVKRFVARFEDLSTPSK